MEIDFIEREKELKTFKEHLNRFVNSHYTKRTLITGIPGAICLLSPNDSYKYMGSSLLFLTIIKLGLIWDRTKGHYFALEKEIALTEEYKKAFKLYDELTTIVAKFIKELGLKNSLEVNVYLTNMLENGIFSINQVSHTQAPYVREALLDLTGAVVCRGECVCRHESSFFTDILNKIGYNSCNINVSMNSKEELESIRKIKDIQYNHEVVGIVDEGRRYYYDPLHGLFLENYGVLNNKRNILKAVGSETYDIEAEVSAVLNDRYREQLYAFYETEPREIEESEMEYLSEESVETFTKNFSYFMEFKCKYLELIREIAILMEKLAPRSNSEINSWKLQKNFTK